MSEDKIKLGQPIGIGIGNRDSRILGKMPPQLVGKKTSDVGFVRGPSSRAF